MAEPGIDTVAASHPLFNPPEAETEVSLMREGTNSLWNLIGQVTGRSGDLRSVVTGAAAEFSVLVTQDIRNSGEYNDELWRQNCMNIAFAAGVGDQWTQDIIDYKADRAKMVADFETQIASAMPSGDEPMTMNKQLRKEEVTERFRARAQSRMDDLLETGTERKRMLQDGAGPTHVAQLVDSGALGWAAYNIMGPGSNPPLPVSKAEAKTMAADLYRYVQNGRKPDERYFEIVAALNAIRSKALVLLGKDDQMPRVAISKFYSRFSANNMRPEEIAFLKTFYGELEDLNSGKAHMDGDGNGGGVLYLPQWLDENPASVNQRNLNEAARNDLLGTLGDGLLILSNEELGGGLSDLPDSVRNFAEGYPALLPSNVRNHDGNSEADKWLGDAVVMDRFLGQADEELRGGSAFSANITTSMGHHLNAVDADQQGSDDFLSSLLGVSTRNEEANLRILTNRHDHPRFNENGNALKGLYTHEWKDDGTAVAGLTDWIAEAAHSGDSEREADARDAALGLIRMTTDNPDRYDALTNTDLTVEFRGTEYPNASFGMVNPTIAKSLADVVISYQEDFGMRPPEKKYVPSGYGINKESGLLALGYMPRLKFLEFVGSDPASAAQLYHSLDLRENASAAGIALGEIEANSEGEKNGRLRALLDGAMRMESLDRTENVTDRKQAIADAEHARKETVVTTLQTVAYAGTGYAGLAAKGLQAANRVAGSFVTAGVGFDQLNDRFVGDPDNVETAYQDANGPGGSDGSTYSEAGMRMRSGLDVINHLVKSKDSGVTMEDVENTAPELVTRSNDAEPDDIKHVDDFTSHDLQGTSDDESSVTKKVNDVLKENGVEWKVENYGNGYEMGYKDTKRGINSPVGKDRAEEIRGFDGSGENPDKSDD